MMRKGIVFCLLIVIFVTGLGAQNKTENVFVVVIDGARYTETFGDETHATIPNIWNTLRPLGVMYTNCRIEGQTSTNPGHASVVTGTWQTISNDGQERPTATTMFEYFRKAKNAPQTEAAVVLGKDKLGILAYGRAFGYGKDFGAKVYSSTSAYEDGAAYDNVRRAIADRVRLAVVNLPATDGGGHSGEWSQYTGNLKGADRIVLDIWNKFQADEFYRGKTTLIITNDHGRHSGTSFDNHGDGCEGCRHIMLLVIGPDTPAGTVDSSPVMQIDIVPTVGRLLGFPTPDARGKVLESAFLKQPATAVK
jgi:hypothetical protein